MVDDTERPNLHLVPDDEPQYEAAEEAEAQSFHTDQQLLDSQLRAQRLDQLQPTGQTGRDIETLITTAGREAYLPYMAEFTDKKDVIHMMMTVRSGLDQSQSQPLNAYSRATIPAEIGAIDRVMGKVSENTRLTHWGMDNPTTIARPFIQDIHIWMDPNFHKGAENLSLGLRKTTQYAEQLVGIEARIDAAYFDIRSVENEAIQRGWDVRIPHFGEIRGSWASTYHQLKNEIGGCIVAIELQRARLIHKFESLPPNAVTSPQFIKQCQKVAMDVESEIGPNVQFYTSKVEALEGRRDLLISSMRGQ